MGAIITKIGLEKIANATANEPLRLEKFAVGDGNGKKIIPNSEMKSLINEKYRDLISDKHTNENNTVFESVIKATAKIDEGFYIRELGLFDEAGDLIVIVDVPAQYRPATTGGSTITELLFNVTVQVHDSSLIEIKINEQLFATVDMLNRVQKRLDQLEKDKQNLIESSVGIDKWFNTDNKYKDWRLIKVGIKTYALMDESNILKIADYPLLFKNINGVDKGDGTFAMPKFHEGTLKHLPIGHIRVLGSFEEDEIKSHKHGNRGHKHNLENHEHLLPDIKGKFWGGFESGSNGAEGAFYEIGGKYFGMGSKSDFDNAAMGFSSHRAGVTRTFGLTERAVTDVAGGEDTLYSGAGETRMKNTGGQWYLLAKIDM